MNTGNYEGMPVLVTGGLGFIGSNLALRLAELGAVVTVVDGCILGCGANRFNLYPRRAAIRVIERELGEADAELEAAIAGANVVFNLAGEISHIHSMEYPERDLQLNTVSQLRFLDSCRRWNRGVRVVYAGTRQVFGRPRYLPIDDKHPIRPVDFNGVHKYAATMYHLMMTELGDLDAVVLRLTNVYGPRMSLNVAGQGFLGVFFRLALLGEGLQVYGDGEQLRDPLYVDDAVEAFVVAGLQQELSERELNIGGAQALSLRQIAEAIQGAAGGPGVRSVEFPPHLKPIDIGSYYTDTRQAKAALGWQASSSFASGVEQTLAFYRQHLEQYLVAGQPPRRELPEHEGVRRRLQFGPVV